MAQASPIVTVDGIQLDPEHVNRALVELKNYHIPMDRIVPEEKVFGSGGFGFVRRAALRPPDSRTSRPITVVIKELKVDNYIVLPLRAAYRLIREISVWAKCEHENILQFIGFHLGENYDPAYLISPYMANGNISEYLKENQIFSGEGLRLIKDTLNGLKYLHTQKPAIVHGDLKAANVLVNDSHRAQLGDFGLSAAVHEDHTGFTTSAAFSGSVRWCGPETIEKSERTCASDIWAWGCLVLEMITGKMPYPNIKSDPMVIVTVVGSRKTPDPDPEPNLAESLLNLMLDLLLRECWKFESDKRPNVLSCESMLDAVISKANLSSNFRPPETSTVDSEAETDSVVGPGDYVADHQIPPELPGTLDVTKEKFVAGPFADLYQGKWVRPGKPPVTVAIKRVRRPGNSIPEKQFQTRIKRETVIWAMVKHPNILPFIGYQIDSTGVPMLISPWCRKGNLSTYIKARPSLSRPERVRLLHGAACGLTHLHTLTPPIVHGDINPEVIIIQDNLEAGLADFGISKIVLAADRRSGFTTSGTTPGTIGFQAIEILEGEPATTASDVFAFGRVILAAMSGKAAYEGQTSLKALIAVMGGETPNRSDHPQLPATDPLWNLLEACSAPRSEERPDMPTVLSKLKDEM